MKKLILIIAILCSQYVGAQNYTGTNIRGKIVTFNAYYNTMVPLQAAVVSLYLFNAYNNQWMLISETITNLEGFYFLYNVPVGNYFLQVNRLKNYPISVVRIDYRQYQFQDIQVLIY